jgi:sugar phosphate isomerase/epimerase
VQAVIESRAANGWEPALQAALPRLGAVALSDVALSDVAPTDPASDKATGPRPCPMGEGVIDWKKFFSILAAARFHGPVSMHLDYEARSEVTSMKKDLAFTRARIEEAWPL